MKFRAAFPGFAGIALAVSAGPGPALAQAYQCRLPERIGPVPSPRPDGPARRTPIGGYVLAASWSPEYCRRGDGSMQCSGRQGRFGFILHGLWPEARRGPPPQWCSMAPAPSPQLLRRNLCMTPSASLLVHEWAKHGTCMVRTPESYFRVSAILWRSLRWPALDRLSRNPALTAGDLRRDSRRSAPRLRGGESGLAAGPDRACHEPHRLAARSPSLLWAGLPPRGLRAPRLRPGRCGSLEGMARTLAGHARLRVVIARPRPKQSMAPLALSPEGQGMDCFVGFATSQ